ncbi:MAG: hypothetical protein LLG04_11690 [Parachlamydia sp.]|nr:hypothetical protein [Parachlamydia sp.]
MQTNFDGRFEIHRFVSSEGNFPQKINDPDFQQLESKYEQRLQTRANDPALQKILNNKIVTALFLDKIPRTSPLAADIQLVRKYGYSSSTIDSMQIIFYLEAIKDDPLLVPETRQALETWVETEREYLDIAIILDGWRAENPQIVGLLKSGSGEGLEKIKCVPPAEEVKLLAEVLAFKFRLFKPWQFKMLGGYNMHETRLRFNRELNGKFTVYHYNTAKETTLKKYTGIQPETLGSTQFWEGFIRLKLEKSDIKEMQKLLESIGRFEDPSFDESFNIPKSTQASDSCPAQAVEADLKHEIVLSAASADEGEMQYKLVKSLMAQKAVELEKGRVEPRLYALIQSKTEIKNRYLHWREIEKDPHLMQEAAQLYLQLIAILEPATKTDQDTKTWTAVHLRRLDRSLNMMLKNASRTQIDKVFKRHDELWPKEKSPIACLKFHRQSADVKEAVHEVLTASRTLSGRMKGALRYILPEGLAKLLDDPNLKVSTLIMLLRREKTEVALPVLREVIGQLSTKEISELLYTAAIRDKDAVIAKGLAEIVVEKGLGDDELKQLCMLLLDRSKTIFDKPIRDLSEDRISLILYALVLNGHRGDAIVFIKRAIVKYFGNAVPLVDRIVSKELLMEALHATLDITNSETTLQSMLKSKYLSGSDQIQLIDYYLEVSHSDTLDFLDINLGLDVLRHLYEKKCLSPSRFEELFLNLQRYNESNWEPHWERDFLLYLTDRTISQPGAYTVFTRNPTSGDLQRKIAEVQLEREDLQPFYRMAYQSFLNPEQFLSDIASLPHPLSQDSFSPITPEEIQIQIRALIRNLKEDDQVERLAEIAVKATHAECFSGCLERLCKKQEHQPQIEALFDSFLKRGGEQVTVKNAESFLWTVYVHSKFQGLAESLYQIGLRHFGDTMPRIP